MKFPRNARVFRGQLDAAPFASVLFLLVLFLLVQSSLVFVPGVRLIPVGDGAPRAAMAGEAARLSAAQRIQFAGRRFSEDDFVAHLRGLASSNQLPAQLILLAEPGTPAESIVRLRDLSRDLKLTFVTPSAGIDLPPGPLTPGTTNPVIAVAVNISGQLFFDNQFCSETQLRESLAAAVRKSNQPLTLLVYADRAVHYEAVERLVNLANQVGIYDLVGVTRPPLFDGRTNTLRP